jgi:methylenetetrahydrofolate reductase (NADPH)
MQESHSEAKMARIRDLLAVQRTVSFEFFPPKTDKATTQLSQAMTELSVHHPDFVSVTYGAGGSDRQQTVGTVIGLQADHQVPTMPHLTCVGHRVSEIDALLDTYAAAGVESILALGGDAPVDATDAPAGDFRYAADLVAHLKADGRFSIGVAAHPEGHPRSPNRGEDRQRLADKLGEADFAVTQFFFNIEDYLSMLEDLAALGCDKPVIPGVIPLTNSNQVARFADMAGATIPSELIDRIAAAADKGGSPTAPEVLELGIEVAVELWQGLLDAGAPGLHFYTLNRSKATKAVLSSLAVSVKQ